MGETVEVRGRVWRLIRSGGDLWGQGETDEVRGETDEAREETDEILGETEEVKRRQLRLGGWDG